MAPEILADQLPNVTLVDRVVQVFRSLVGVFVVLDGSIIFILFVMLLLNGPIFNFCCCKQCDYHVND